MELKNDPLPHTRTGTGKGKDTILYHASFEPVNSFTPRVPQNVGRRVSDGRIVEDTETPRICLSSYFNGCVNAMPDGAETVAFMHRFGLLPVLYLYEFHIRKDSRSLTGPDELVERGLVPDAKENGEYWYTGKTESRRISRKLIQLTFVALEKGEKINGEPCCSIVLSERKAAEEEENEELLLRAMDEHMRNAYLYLRGGVGWSFRNSCAQLWRMLEKPDPDYWRSLWDISPGNQK